MQSDKNGENLEKSTFLTSVIPIILSCQNVTADHIAFETGIWHYLWKSNRLKQIKYNKNASADNFVCTEMNEVYRFLVALCNVLSWCDIMLYPYIYNTA